MNRVDVLIPFGADSPLRTKIWRFNEKLWRAIPGASVLLGEDRGWDGPGHPFSPGTARNDAFRKSDSEWVLCYDSDEFPPTDEQLAGMFERAESDGSGWAIAFDGTRFLTVAASKAVLVGAPVEYVELDVRAKICTGPTLVHRDLFKEIGGYDSSFDGWGF